MENGNLPLESAIEPEEEARQPFSQSMPPSQNKAKNLNITFADSEKPDSQTSSLYKDVLSQPEADLSHRQRLLWLQKRRTKGLWVQCDDCDSWRYLPDVLDSYELPLKWYCRMNPDPTLSYCSAPEEPIRVRDEEDLIHGEYAAGSLVLARLPGWPWWPAMVDDCPDTEQYYWLDGFSDIPTHYNVVFFDAFEVTRAWMAPNKLKPYSDNKNLLKTGLKRKAYSKRLDIAISQANDAEKLSLPARLTKYSFIARFHGPIASPKKVNKNDIKKYKNNFKRKFNIDLPNESSDSENEINENQTNVKYRRNVITLGKKKSANNEVKSNINVINSVKDSLVVQVNSNSDIERNVAKETTSLESSCETTDKILHRAASTASDDFDF